MPSTVRSTSAAAALIVLFAVLAAWTGELLAPAVFAALDWMPYDLWHTYRSPVPPSPSIILITRDAAGEARFGTGTWDYALFARAITALGRAGAAVVGLDVQVGGTSPPGRGGAASDAMLIEATRGVGRMVYPVTVQPAAETTAHESPTVSMPAHRSWPDVPQTTLSRLPEVILTGGPRASLAQHAAGLGHVMISADKDGVVRRVPLYVHVDDRAIPAFSMALLTSFLHVSPEQIVMKAGHSITFRDARFPDGRVRRLSIPVDGHGRMLISYTGREARRRFSPYPFSTSGRRLRMVNRKSFGRG
ncbi:MAG: CHASE2 domain-containing protein [Nitrospiraceae bacterium]|nr:CHASE2 domain-containing protein [Nitrospiraceae bacterium]